MRDHNGELTFGPRLPERITRLRFRVVYRGRKLTVTVTPATGHLPAGGRRAARHPPPRPAGHRRPPGPGARHPAGAAGRAGAPAARLRAPAAHPPGMTPLEPACRTAEGSASSQLPRTQRADVDEQEDAHPEQGRHGVSRASWSASESGRPPAAARGLQLEHGARRGQQQEPGRDARRRRPGPPAAATRWRRRRRPPVTRTDHSPYQLRICTSSSASSPAAPTAARRRARRPAARRRRARTAPGPT